jgi:hypothetical protein
MNDAIQTKTMDRSRGLYQRPVLAIVLLLVLYVMTEAISEFSARSLIGNSEALGRTEGKSASVWAGEHDLSRYFASSIKGTAEITPRA